MIHTPTFDRVAREGVLFNYVFSASPSCSASRAAILTGQYPHRLEDGADLWGTLPKKFPVYSDLLEKSGYYVGLTRKGWGPGDFRPGGYTHNPAGRSYKSFAEFFHSVPAGKPFCFWFGVTSRTGPTSKDRASSWDSIRRESRCRHFGPTHPRCAKTCSTIMPRSSTSIVKSVRYCSF